MSVPASLTVLIPAYNEEENIGAAIDSIQRALQGVADDYEIIVIDDGSRDGTAAVVQRRMKADSRIKCVSNGGNEGYGYSFWRGVGLANKDYVSVFPGDNDMAWDSFRDLVEKKAQADLIFSYMQNPQDRDWPRRTLSQLFVNLMNAAFNMRLKYFNGPLVARRQLLQSLSVQSTGLTILAECKVRLIKRGCSYLEIPFTYTARSQGRSSALRPKSIKAVVGAMSSLYRDIYCKKMGD